MFIQPNRLFLSLIVRDWKYDKYNDNKLQWKYNNDILSLFQIRDWLTVEEEMLRKQAVVVGDVGEIMEALDKQMVSRLSSLARQIHDSL